MQLHHNLTLMADTRTQPTFLPCLLLLTSHSCKCWMRQFVHSYVLVILMKPVIKYWDSRMKASRFFLFIFSIDRFVVSVVLSESRCKLVHSCSACLPCSKTQNTCLYTHAHNTVFYSSVYIVHEHNKMILKNTFTQILPLTFFKLSLFASQRRGRVGVLLKINVFSFLKIIPSRYDIPYFESTTNVLCFLTAGWRWCNSTVLTPPSSVQSRKSGWQPQQRDE